MSLEISRTVSPPAKSNAAWLVGALLIVTVALVVGAGLLLSSAVAVARQQARQSISMGHLKGIALALHNYHDQYGEFPPAVVRDSSGQPLYSGRVLLLPYLEEKRIYDAWDLSVAWDHPRNSSLAETNIAIYRDPDSADHPPGEVDYLFITGPQTLFEEGRSNRLSDVTDGSASTLMVVEVRHSGIGWAEPRDLDIEQLSRLPRGHRPGVNLAVFADGQLTRLPTTTPAATLRAAATRDGGEAVVFPSLP